MTVARTSTMPLSREDLVLVVTLRKSGGYRLRAFAGFPLDLTTAKPLEGFEDVAFPLHEWLQGEHPTIEALKPLLTGRPRVRFCYDPSDQSLLYLTLLPLEDVFVRRFGVPLSRHPLTKAGELAAPYAQDVSISGKLKVLLIYANPDPRRFPPGARRDPEHLPHLKEHWSVLIQALGGLVSQQLVAFERLDNEDGRLTAQPVIARIKTFNPHLLVYVGHGYYDAIYGKQGLHWGDPDEERLPFGVLRATLDDMARRDEKPALRLLVLIACHSAKAGPQLQTPTFSEGKGVQEVQVPAVVGMDREFPAAAVATFAKPFFGAVSERQSVEEAFSAALRALHASSDPVLTSAHGLPRLWLAASHSRLFPPSEDCARGLYLEKVKGEYGQVAFANRATTVPLKDLYVDRVVVERKEDSQQRQPPQTSFPSASEQITHLERHAIEPPEKVVELWTAVKDHRRVLVTAEARTGKSTLCQHLVMNCDQQTRWFPIFLRFSAFARSDKSLREFLQENHAESLGLDKLTVLTSLGDSAKEVPFGEWLYLQWEAGNALLIVDGLDEEFNEERRAAALSRIPLTADKQKQPRVLFTSRPFGTMLVKDAYVLHLKEFEKDEQLRCCARNCERILARLEGRDADEQRVTKFLKALAEDRRRKDLARRPGHLVEMYVQFCDTGTTSLFEDALLEWVAQERFKEKVRAEVDFQPSVALRRHVLEEVCFHLLFCQERSWAYDEEMLALVAEVTSPSHEGGNRVERDRVGSLMLTDLVRNSGFLREARVDGKDAYEVESALWLQFFAAHHIARKLRERDSNFKQWVCDGVVSSRSAFRNAIGSALRRLVPSAVRNPHSAIACSVCAAPLPPFSHYLWHAEQHEVIVLLAAVLQDATPLLERIEREPDDIFNRMLTLLARALGRAAQADTEVVQRTCSRLIKAWQSQGVRPGTLDDAALIGLGRAKTPRHAVLLLDALCAAFHDTDGGVRRAAAGALGKIGGATAVAALRVALHDANWFARQAAAGALKEIGDATAVAALRAALDDTDEGVRIAAAEALGEIGDATAVAALLTTLHDANKEVRRAAAGALGKIGDATVVAALCAALHDVDQHVRWVAAEALRTISEREGVRILPDGRMEKVE